MQYEHYDAVDEELFSIQREATKLLHCASHNEEERVAIRRIVEAADQIWQTMFLGRMVPLRGTTVLPRPSLQEVYQAANINDPRAGSTHFEIGGDDE